MKKLLDASLAYGTLTAVAVTALAAHKAPHQINITGYTISFIASTAIFTMLYRLANDMSRRGNQRQ